MQVDKDFICEHGMPKPWATCIECMSLPPDERPTPPVEVVKPPPKPAPRKRAATRSAGSSPRAPRAKRAPAAPKAGRLPRSQSDTLPELIGDKDLAYEIPPSDLRYFTTGAEADWLPLSLMPRELRPRGFVYLQIDADLVARARVSGVGFRDRRWAHAAPEAATELGPGATLELEAGWSPVDIDLGPDGDAPVSGYRYLV